VRATTADKADAKTDESRDPPSSQADQSTPTSHDNTPSSTFPIDPASSYTVVTGTVTLTGEAAVSAIKAGATPLDAQGATETKEKDKEGGPGAAVIAGIVGGVVLLLLLGCWVWYRVRPLI
jgi:cobalamin biosynthesis Mg chelatase CobN